MLSIPKHEGVSRVFTDIFDYNARRSMHGLEQNENMARAMIARLRLDALIFDKIVFADVQVIHSMFLSGLSSLPADRGLFADHIPVNSIEIRTRERTFQESIISLVKDPKESNLKSHLFTFIDPEFNIKDEITKVRSSEVQNWQDIPRILKLILGNEYADRISQSEESWAFWIEKEKRSLIKNSQWLDKTKFNFSVTLKKQIDKQVQFLCKTELSEYGSELIHKLKNGEMNRGDLASLLSREDENRKLTAQEYYELELIEHRFSIAYNSTSALQHQCPHYDTNMVIINSIGGNGDVNQFREKNHLKELSEASDISMNTIIGLSEMPNSVYERVLEDMQTRLARWRDKGDIEEFKIVADYLHDEIDRTGIPATILSEDKSKLQFVIPYLRIIKNIISDIAVAVPALNTLGFVADTLIGKIEGVQKRKTIKSLVNFADQRVQ